MRKPKKHTVGFHKLLETVTKEEFINYFWSHSRAETAEHFQIGFTVFGKFCKYYNIKKPKELINKLRDETNLKMYGVKNQFQRVDYLQEIYIKNFGSLDEKYKVGAKHAKENARKQGYNSMSQTPEAKAKRVKTCQKKYHVDSVLKAPEVQEKINDKMISEYGDRYYNNPEKREQTNLKKYGVKYTFSSPDENINGKANIRKKYEETGDWNNRQKAKQTCLDKFGEDYYIKQIEKMLLAQSHSSESTPNKVFASYLISLGLIFEKEFKLNNFFYDFKLGNYLVEIDPYATHNSTWGLYRNPKSYDYHRRKSLNALENGYKCIHIWDWTCIDEILWAILNHKIEFIDLGKEQKHIFNVKKKQLVNQFTDDCVEIYDDGFKLNILP